MRVFVSYSRQDATFTGEIVDALEARGFDVWMDTDDIRGSEPWRRSIVEGIAAADAVVLIVSPFSMASPNVEREVTVAAEQGRQIVPLVLEPAPLAPGMQYELAGVQQVMAAGRPARDVAGDLTDALRRPSAGERAAPARPARAVGRKRGSPIIAVGVVALVLAGIGAVALLPSGGEDGGEGAGDIVDTLPSAAPAERTLDASVWFGGFRWTASEARLDEDAGEIVVDITIENVQDADADPLGALVDDQSAMELDGRRSFLSCDSCIRLPPGAATSATLSARIEPGEALDRAVVVFGEPRQHQARIPLDGSAATSDVPRSVAASGALDDTVTATFTLQRVDVYPASCTGFPEELELRPGPSDEVAVVVVGTAVNYGDRPVNLGQATLTLPGGGPPRSSVTLADNTVGLPPGVPVDGLAACFHVPAPAAGEYLFTTRSSGAETWPAPVALTL